MKRMAIEFFVCTHYRNMNTIGTMQSCFNKAGKSPEYATFSSITATTAPASMVKVLNVSAHYATGINFSSAVDVSKTKMILTSANSDKILYSKCVFGVWSAPVVLLTLPNTSAYCCCSMSHNGTIAMISTPANGGTIYTVNWTGANPTIVASDTTTAGNYVMCSVSHDGLYALVAQDKHPSFYSTTYNTTTNKYNTLVSCLGQNSSYICNGGLYLLPSHDGFLWNSALQNYTMSYLPFNKATNTIGVTKTIETLGSTGDRGFVGVGNGELNNPSFIIYTSSGVGSFNTYYAPWNDTTKTLGTRVPIITSGQTNLAQQYMLQNGADGKTIYYCSSAGVYVINLTVT